MYCGLDIDNTCTISVHVIFNLPLCDSVCGYVTFALIHYFRIENYFLSPFCSICNCITCLCIYTRAKRCFIHVNYTNVLLWL